MSSKLTLPRGFYCDRLISKHDRIIDLGGTPISLWIVAAIFWPHL